MPTRTITSECTRLLSITGRLGKRLNHHLRTLPPGAVPDANWREAYVQFGTSMRMLATLQQQWHALIARYPHMTLPDGLEAERLAELDGEHRDTARRLRAADRAAEQPKSDDKTSE